MTNPVSANISFNQLDKNVTHSTYQTWIFEASPIHQLYIFTLQFFLVGLCIVKRAFFLCFKMCDCRKHTVNVSSKDKSMFTHKHTSSISMYCGILLYPKYIIINSVSCVLAQCKLEFQRCLSGKKLSVKCDGPCPCLPAQEHKQTPRKADRMGECLI